MEKTFLSVMVKLMLNKKGFTFIETLFVISIISILSVLTMGYALPEKKDEHYIQEISQFLNEAKLSAMTDKRTVTIQFYKHKITYSHSHIQKEYELKKGTYFDEYKMTFNAYGHIKTAKTISYHMQDKVYQFVYQVGSGYVYVQ